MLGRELEQRAGELIRIYAARGLKIATAESCTGGMIAAALTDIAGSSAVVERGFVTYSNEAKIEMLGVPAELIASIGAVSAETAAAWLRRPRPLSRRRRGVGHRHCRSRRR